MNNEKIKQHIDNARVIEKKNIYGMYFISLIFSFFGGAIAILEYNHYIVFFLFIGIILLSLICSIIFLKKQSYNLYSKFVGLGLSFLWLVMSFNYIILYFISIEYSNSAFGIWFVIIVEVAVAMSMVLLMFRNIKKGFKTWQYVLISISGGVTPLLIIVFAKYSSITESISDELAIIMMPFIIGFLCYPVFDNFIKAYYIKKLNLL